MTLDQVSPTAQCSTQVSGCGLPAKLLNVSWTSQYQRGTPNPPQLLQPLLSLLCASILCPGAAACIYLPHGFGLSDRTAIRTRIEGAPLSPASEVLLSGRCAGGGRSNLHVRLAVAFTAGSPCQPWCCAGHVRPSPSPTLAFTVWLAVAGSDCQWLWLWLAIMARSDCQ